MVDMPKDSSSYLEMTYSSINIFANDGTLDERELSFLLGLALKDGEIDDDEKRVLKTIFDQIPAGRLTSIMQRRVDKVKEKYQIS